MRPIFFVVAFIELIAASAALAAAPEPSPPVDNVASPTHPVRSGVFRGRAVTFVEIDGRQVLEGDILLDHVAPLPVAAPDKPTPQGFGVAYAPYVWPKVGGVARIPYVIASGSTNLTTAIAQFNATFAGLIQLTPRVAEADHVRFDLAPANQSGVCFSNLGRVGGEQTVGGSGACAVGTLLHEIGHTIGLYHEHVRPDRDTFVSVSDANMIKGSRSNFDLLPDNFEAFGPYDFGSVMHYPPNAFSRNGKAVIESKPLGVPLSNPNGYTAADIDSIKRLYGVAPTAVTIATNPAGMRVRVDNVLYTSPATFNWAMGSTHTLAIPSGLQTLDGRLYMYARWSHSTLSTNTITVTPGAGTLATPKTSPATTVYTLNYREVVRFTASVYPPGAGTIAASPAASPIAGSTGVFYLARQTVRLTATPAPGYNFVYWGSSGAPFVSAPWSANPKLEQGPGSIIAYFSAQPVYTVTTSPPGLGVRVDGQFWYGPQSFASDYFPTWTPGSAHTVSSLSPQLPYSVNSRYRFHSWSDAGAFTHSYVAPASAATLTARFYGQFAPVVYGTPWCASNVTLTPASALGDGFYNTGSTVTATAPAAPGWTLTGWRYDLSGVAASQPIVVRDEVLAIADYNTAATPLLGAGLTPARVTAGAGPLTVAVNGTGFTPSSIVFVNNIYRPTQFVSPTQINVDLTSGDVASAGAFPIGVSNFPPAASCSAYAPQGFFVTQP